jgi:hypothetical protein
MNLIEVSGVQLFKNAFIAFRTELHVQIGCDEQADIHSFIYMHLPHAIYAEST